MLDSTGVSIMWLVSLWRDVEHGFRDHLAEMVGHHPCEAWKGVNIYDLLKIASPT